MADYYNRPFEYYAGPPSSPYQMQVGYSEDPSLASSIESIVQSYGENLAKDAVKSKLGLDGAGKAGLGGYSEVMGGAGPTAGLGAMAALYGAGMYNYGGKDVLEGDADSADYVNLALQSNPLTATVNPIFDVVGLGSVGESLGLDRKTHKDYAAENYGSALKQASSDVDKQAIQHFYDQALGQMTKDNDAIYDSGPLKGRKWNWDEVKNVGTGEDVWGEVGFFQAMPDWISGYSENQRRDIAEAALAEDLLSHSKAGRTFEGDDLSRIQEIANAVREGDYQPTISKEERDAERSAYLQQLLGTRPYKME